MYLGWVGFHNLGDEWMWQLFRSMAERHLDLRRVEVVPSLPGVDIDDLDRYDTIVLGGGSLLIPGYTDRLAKALRMGKRVIIWGSGYDEMSRIGPGPADGRYTDPVREPDGYLETLREVISGAAFAGVRGPWTRAYLEARQAAADRLLVSGDPAVMTPADDSPADAGAAEGGRWIGMNWGTSYGRIYGGREADVEDQLVLAARRLAGEGYKLYLYVMWGPDRGPAKRLYEKINLPEQVIFDPGVHDYPHYLRLMRKFEATINFKLHANVLSAVSGVPFVCLGYRFKSYDLMEGLGLGSRIVPTDEPQLGERAASLLAEAAADRTSFAALLGQHRVRSRALLEMPFREGLL